MNIIEIIEKKRDHQKLSNNEIEYFVNGYVNDEIKDYQASALLMAICINGLDMEELKSLTQAMLNSGDVMDLSDISGVKVDKHSTGGVGDKTSLALGPILAACGLEFAKMSGRGLSHTGGTLDKLEAIDGFQINLEKERFIKQVNDIHIAIIGQTGNLVPADKKLYALRDVTGTVPSIPLIASSIMSKKIAAGADIILLDVKYGDGAFMPDKESAEQLAKTMISIGEQFNKTIKAEITSMEEPLGNAIGNTLEVKEAIATLQGKGPSDFSELCIHSASTLLMIAKQASTELEAREKVENVIANGKAFQIFVDMVKAQNGNIEQIIDPNKMKQAKYIVIIKANKEGYINKIHTRQLGLLACELGAGRKRKEDSITHEVGFILHKKCCDYVNANDILCEVHTNTILDETFLNDIRSCFIVNENKKDKIPLIYKTI